MEKEVLFLWKKNITYYSEEHFGTVKIAFLV